MPLVFEEQVGFSDRAREYCEQAVKMYDAEMYEPAAQRLRVALENVLWNFLSNIHVKRTAACKEYAKAQDEKYSGTRMPKLQHIIGYMEQDPDIQYNWKSAQPCHGQLLLDTAIDHMHFIRKKGNAGSHDNDSSVTQRDVEQCAEYLSEIARALFDIVHSSYCYFSQKQSTPPSRETSTSTTSATSSTQQTYSSRGYGPSYFQAESSHTPSTAHLEPVRSDAAGRTLGEKAEAERIAELNRDFPRFLYSLVYLVVLFCAIMVAYRISFGIRFLGFVAFVVVIGWLAWLSCWKIVRKSWQHIIAVALLVALCYGFGHYFSPENRLARYVNRNSNIQWADVQSLCSQVKYASESRQRTVPRAIERSTQKNITQLIRGRDSAAVTDNRLQILDEVCQNLALQYPSLTDSQRNIKTLRGDIAAYSAAQTQADAEHFVAAVQLYRKLESSDSFAPAAEQQIGKIQKKAVREMNTTIQQFGNETSAQDWSDLCAAMLSMQPICSKGDWKSWRRDLADHMEQQNANAAFDTAEQWNVWLDGMSDVRSKLDLDAVHDFEQSDVKLYDAYAAFISHEVNDLLEQHDLIAATELVGLSLKKAPKHAALLAAQQAVDAVDAVFLDELVQQWPDNLLVANTTVTDGRGQQHAGTHTLYGSTGIGAGIQIVVPLDSAYTHLHGTIFVGDQTDSADGLYGILIYSSQTLDENAKIYSSGLLSKDSSVVVDLPLDGLDEIVIVLANNTGWVDEATIILEDFLLFQ